MKNFKNCLIFAVFLTGVVMHVKMWSANSFFDFSFENYLKKYVGSKLDEYETCFFFKVSTDSIFEFITKLERLMMSNVTIVLVSSKRYLPLCAFFTQVNKDLYIMFRGALYGRNSDLGAILPKKIK